ncbi:hypothetical protein NEOKW01_1523 [Nematocida sp. AWRm80]|nr:hypothetical protein NEOKW01_1523 [Nematocida sp. AWRm80]
MESFGRVFNDDWSLPIKSSLVNIIFKSHSQKQSWQISYDHQKQAWRINNLEILPGQVGEILFEGLKYYVSFTRPIEGYFQEINQIASVINSSKLKTLQYKQIHRQLKKHFPADSQTKRNYKSILRSSGCFIRVILTNTFGEKQIHWGTNKKCLEDLKASWAATQNIVINSKLPNLEVSLFYSSN